MLHEVLQENPKDSKELEILKGNRGTKVNQRTVRKKGYCREPKDK